MGLTKGCRNSRFKGFQIIRKSITRLSLQNNALYVDTLVKWLMRTCECSRLFKFRLCLMA